MTHASSQVPRSALSARLDSWLALVTEPLAALAVVAEIVILLTGVISRFVFNHPLTWSDELATITFLWLAMLGSVMALRRGQHMRMTAVLERFGGANRGVVEAIGSVAPVLFLAIVLLPAVDFAHVAKVALSDHASPRLRARCPRPPRENNCVGRTSRIRGRETKVCGVIS